MKLRKTQKNYLFEIIEESGLSPAMFNLLEDDGKTNSNKHVIIKVINQPYHFTFGDKGRNIEYFYSPSTDHYEINGEESDFTTLIDEHFFEWIDCLKEELTTEDKWANFNSLFQSLDIDNFYNEQNDKFSASEFLNLELKMKALKNSLPELNFDSEKLKILENKLDQVLDKAIELGKYDWRSLLIGTMISMILQLSLSQEQGKQLWELIKRIFSSFFLTQ